MLLAPGNPLPGGLRLGVSLCNKSNLFASDPNTSIIEIDMEAKSGTSYAKGLIYASKNR